MCQDLGSILFYEQVHICHCPVSCLPHLTICGSGAAAELGADKCGVFNQDKRMLSEIAPGLGWVDIEQHMTAGRRIIPASDILAVCNLTQQKPPSFSPRSASMHLIASVQ